MDDLPSYSPSSPTPSYSRVPASGESVLATSPTNFTTPTGTYEKWFGSSRIILTGQEDGTTSPSYGRKGVINGTIEFDDVQTVEHVRLKLIGKLKSSVTGSTSCSKSTRILYQTESVWSRLSEARQGPLSVSFATSFPATFRDGVETRPLPSSYEIAYAGNPSLSARCSYHLKIIVRYRSSLWPKKKTITIPITYTPRKRPPQPVLRGCDFRSTVKSLPEEWFETSSILIPQRLHEKPLQARFYIPAVKIFGLSDNIPIHIQLKGPVSSLRKFCSCPQTAPTENTPTHKHHSSCTVLTVKLIRQASIKSLPPTFELSGSHPESSINGADTTEELEWAGELRCNDNVRVGQFDAGNVSVRDFVIFSFDSPEQNYSFSSVPIALVTDTWSEDV
ncbi:hypothetical protein AAF712_003681 [Marasmius tenuissimus]|uniref:Arrestin-like N-terminal domain-containing protein n=1 Tax=Marasmius tenuissimus TaxID=585030 RepID=A0ABR3A7N2_9AGAR